MALLFSAVTLTGDDDQVELLVPGIPKESNDLRGWTAYEHFIASIDHEQEIRVHLDQKQMQVEDELTKALDSLYCKNVPAGVRDYFNLRSGTPEPVQPKVKKPRAEKAAPAVADVAPL